MVPPLAPMWDYRGYQRVSVERRRRRVQDRSLNVSDYACPLQK